MQSIDKEGMFIVSEETVLFRIWIPEDSFGVLNLLRKNKGGAYFDTFEAEITKEKGAYICQPRNRGKDIFEDWLPLLTQELLNPLTTGYTKLNNEHAYGKGLLQKYSNPKNGIKGWRLAEIGQIEEAEFRAMESGLQS